VFSKKAFSVAIFFLKNYLNIRFLNFWAVVGCKVEAKIVLKLETGCK
jgi:hypothetical protein